MQFDDRSVMGADWNVGLLVQLLGGKVEIQGWGLGQANQLRS